MNNNFNKNSNQCNKQIPNYKTNKFNNQYFFFFFNKNIQPRKGKLETKPFKIKKTQKELDPRRPHANVSEGHDR